MSLLGAMKIATQGMSSQGMRMNLVASNMANADVSAKSESEVYKAKHAFFETLEQANGSSGVAVRSIENSKDVAKLKYDPADPNANEKGMVYKPNVDVAGEMADLISASRAYQLNAEVANMSRALYQKALNIGQ